MINGIILFTNLHMPLLAHGIDNTSLDGSPAGTTDWDTHLVVARQTVKLSLQLSGFSCQFLAVNRKTVKHITVRNTCFELTAADHFSYGPDICSGAVFSTKKGAGVVRLTRSCCS